jgi:hypothetical protein
MFTKENNDKRWFYSAIATFDDKRKSRRDTYADPAVGQQACNQSCTLHLGQTSGFSCANQTSENPRATKKPSAQNSNFVNANRRKTVKPVSQPSSRNINLEFFCIFQKGISGLPRSVG